MVTQPDVPLPADEWVNLTSEISASAGDDLIVQNIGSVQIRVENSVGDPGAAVADVGLCVNPKESAQATTGGSENVWARAIGENSIAHAEVL